MHQLTTIKQEIPKQFPTQYDTLTLKTSGEGIAVDL